MKGFWKTWIVLGTALVVLLGGMGWISLLTMRLEDRESEALRQAEREESVRLALWRMESMLTPLIAQESARPYFMYSALFPPHRAYSCMFGEPQEGDTLVPSALLDGKPDEVYLHFQYSPDGELTSPQVLPQRVADPAAFLGCVREDACLGDFETRLNELRGLLSHKDLLDLLPPASEEMTVATVSAPIMPKTSPIPREQGRRSQEALNRNDLEFRNFTAGHLSVQQNLWASNTAVGQLQDDVVESLIAPRWFRDELFLVRRVVVAGREYVQGCWLDWAMIRQRLLSRVVDLLPNASLAAAVDDEDSAEDSRRLQALPVRLEPGELPPNPDVEILPVRFSLGIAWACVLLAGLAVGAVLVAALTLSERRASFVSAVTHELRTPLTTFRMYTEMLDEGMVRDEDQRRSYVAKLRTEADRLGHLVENVLGFARLEAGRGCSVERVPLRELVERPEARLRERAQQSAMELELDEASLREAGDCLVAADRSAVEQILFNLVDNACKYAACATDRTIRIEAAAHGAGAYVLRVRDHGPGVPESVRSRLFRPFSKSDTEAASSAPGVGLGLAFCRRLARAMGASLRLSASGPGGACFELRLAPSREER